MAAAVPGADRLAGHVVQHPALARFHAGLVDAVAEHVVVVAHDDATQRVAILHDGVAHLSLVAFDVQFNAGGIFLLDDGVVPLKAVVRNREEGAAQCVEMRDGGRLTVNGRFACCDLAPDQFAAKCDALFVPRGKVVCVGQPREESLHVRIRLRIAWSRRHSERCR